MTVMLPDAAPASASAAERRLFRLIKTQLSDDWHALHSLGLLGHPRKPWAEIDFVLVGPTGIFCLEVKGGRVTRDQGLWVFTDRNNRETRKREGPFEQVGPAAAQLRRYVVDHLPTLRKVLTGFGVATPDIRFDVAGPDIETEIVYDVRDIDAPISRYIDRLADHWRSRYSDRAGELSPRDRGQVVDLLRGDFDLRPTLRVRMGYVTEELVRLTEQQSGVLEGLSDNDRVLVRGGAGTGKTMLALEEVSRLSRSGLRVLYCCFSRRLAAQIRLASAELGPNVAVRTLHGLMADIVRERGMEDRLPPAEESDRFQVFYPDLALEALLEDESPWHCDTLIVDEAQDLLAHAYVDVFDALLRGGIDAGIWRLFLDPKQNVFFGVEPTGLERVIKTAHAEYRLGVNCRNTAPIATHTALLSGLHPEETLIVDGPDVEIYWYKDQNDELRQLVRHLNRLLSEGARPGDIVIVGRRQLSGSSLASGLDELPCAIAEWDVRRDEGTIAYSTVAGFKGLESDIVALIDVDDLVTPDSLSLIYVGASRARIFLSVFASESARSDYDELARRFGETLARAESQAG